MGKLVTHVTTVVIVSHCCNCGCELLLRAVVVGSFCFGFFISKATNQNINPTNQNINNHKTISRHLLESECRLTRSWHSGIPHLDTTARALTCKLDWASSQSNQALGLVHVYAAMCQGVSLPLRTESEGDLGPRPVYHGCWLLAFGFCVWLL